MLVFKGRVGEILLFYALAALLALYLSLPLLSQVPPTEEGRRPESAAFILMYILIATFLFLLIARFLPHILRILIYVLELLFLALSSLLLFYTMFGAAGIPLSISILLARVLLRRNPFLANLSTAIISGVVSGMMGIAFGPIPLVLLGALLAVYDYLSVFVTKHMVELARRIVGPHKPFGVYALGSGDVVVPITLAVGLGRINPILSFVGILGAILGVFLALYLVRRMGRPLPALPPILFVQLLFTWISLLFL